MGTGRITRLYEDKGRKDIYSDEMTRRIPVSIYYPTKKEGDSFYKDLYYPKTDMLCKIYLEGKEERRERLESLRMNFINNAEPDFEHEKMPVVVFSHGLSADRDFYMFLISYLAMKGYFIVTVGHLYDTDFTLLPDGSVVEMKHGLLGESRIEDRRKQVRFRSEDFKFILDRLPEISEEFKGMADLKRVSAIGHSLGAMTVFYSMNHEILKSGILLDAPMSFIEDEKIAKFEETGKKILNIRREGIDLLDTLVNTVNEAKDKSDSNFRKSILSEYEKASKEAEVTGKLFRAMKEQEEYFIEMKGTDHLTFTDWYYLLNDVLPEKNEPIEVSHIKLQEIAQAFLEETLDKKKDSYKNLIKSGKLPGVHVENTVKRLF